MWEIFEYFCTRFGLRSERKRTRELNVDEDDMNDQTCKQRKLNHQYIASEQFLCPAASWRPAAATKRQSLPSGQPRRGGLSKAETSWLAESKENIIDISDTEDVEVVGMWQDTNTLRKCPVYRTGINRKDIQPDDEIEVVKVVEPLSKEMERNRNSITIMQTPRAISSINGKTSSRNHLPQPLKVMHSSSRSEDRKPRLALNESFRLEDKMKYSQLLQKYTNVPLQTSIKTPVNLQKREVSPAGLELSRKNSKNVIIDLTKPDRVTQRRHVEISKNREHQPSTSSSRRDSGDEPQVIKSNSLDRLLKLNIYCQEDLVTSINEKYKQKIQAWKKEEMEEKIKVDHFKKRDKKFQMESLERLTNYLKITDAIVEDICIEEESKLPQLTSDMEKLIDEALIPKPPNEVLVEAFGLPIKRHDMQTLAGLNWLNDEVINFYMELLRERGKLENYLSVYAFNTFFYPRLLSGGHAALKRWTRKVDIFSFDLLIVPVHLGVHWCLAAIDLCNKTIKYYDSMGSPNNKCLQSLMKYLQEESLDKKKQKFDTSGWQMENVQDIPQQMNGSDCGMFSCVYAEFICRNAKFTFTQKDMPYFRRKMVYEIFKQKLLM